MAMAVKSSLVYSGIGSGIQTPECWSSTGWEHETLTDPWEWEDPNSNYSTRQGEGHLRMQSNDWTTASSSAVTLATKSDELSHVYALGTTGTSVSSGIPGVAASGGSRGSDSSTLVKHEPDDNGVTRSGHNDSLFFSLGRGNEDGPPEEADRTRGQSNGSSVMSGGGDSSQNVTLKLGRRTYLEDNAKTPSLALPPPGKKQRPLSPSTHIPRCQVEGCKADLSGCKDYHKRHKVCEMHSKAPKATTGGIEQRFCQQCSRFHILKEFDEGKRSCRRRLAGHNERRRKPHPETPSLFGLGNPFLHREMSAPTMGGAPFYFPDIKPSSALPPHRGSLFEYGLHSYGHSLTRSSPWSLKSRNDNLPTFQIQDPKTPMTTLQPSPGLSLGGHHFLEGSSLGPLGQGLSLSSSAGGPLGSMEQQQQQSQHISSCSQSLSSVSAGMTLDSGRALSLLSSKSWAPCPPQLSVASSTQAPVVSGGLSQAPGDSTLEQLVASSSSNDSSNRGIISRVSHHLQPSSTTTSSAPPQQFGNNKQYSGGLNFGLTVTTGTTGTHEQRGGCGNNMLAGLGAYNNETTNWGQDLMCHSHSHQGRATMDLMQTLPSVHAHHGGSHSNGVVHSQVSTSGLYNSGFSDRVRPFESSRFSDQQLL